MANTPVTADTDLGLKKASDFLNLSADTLAGVIGAGKEEEPDTTPETEEVEEVEAETAETEAEAEAEGEEEVEEEAQAAAAETGAKAPPATETPVVPTDRKLATEFQVFDPQGELEIPDIKIKFKARGQEREAPLDKVVRWAQLGVAREESLEYELPSLRKEAAEAKSELDELKGVVKEYDSYLERLFTDDGFAAQAKQAFLAQNSPAMRAMRAEQEAQAARHEALQQAEDQQIMFFTQNTLAPNVESLSKQHPMVSQDEIMGRFSLLVAPLLHRGRIPLQALPQVSKLVEGELADWVSSLQDDREGERKRAEAKVQAAKTEAALAKRRVAKRTAPPGASAAARGKPSKPPKTSKEWLNSIFPDSGTEG